ncbi:MULTISPECIES: MgtC/SapB family protein [Modicisalibacter]|uniref:MgtC/SapB family protein n=1 Tax=Modicisalibacter TaxID=574347 RepID=UPI00100B65DF|nr:MULTISPECIES: MgtC/SapB family protein [Halomonadaceae]MBZ9560133.1 MgtC/SapB family protein [Modicisalibacter sp. R2A 31.J]MBZ9576041.1 MgtC/SapB family protein [Modicisalibacter sp. MOD 31.J]
MQGEALTIVFNLGAAWLAGSLIGLERSFHGRPAGFRTHALVCASSALLMLVTTYQWQWLDAGIPESTIRTDPTRMAQGIMTGIGFLGAGVIFKEGLNVHGLTTAASIWITSALGILFGVGFMMPAVLATVGTLLTLSLFRWVEQHLPSECYADHVLSYARESAPDEASVRRFIGEYDCRVQSISYRLSEHGSLFQYHMVLQTHDKRNLARLAHDLRHSSPNVLEFRLAPAGE